MAPPNVAIIGLGLIGGSLAHAWRDALALTAFDVDEYTRAAAARDGIEVHGTLEAAVAGADVVVVAVPVDCTATTLATLGRILPATTLVTDTASVKQPVVGAARQAGLRFVGGHPMAGREAAGYGAATESLFAGARWALCVEDDTVVADVLALTALVLLTGAGVAPLAAAAHDRAVAVVSHLPHVFATALAARAGADDEGDLLLGLAAGSFRDATRVARAPAAFWSAVLRENASPMSDVLREQAATLTRVAALAERGDEAALEQFFAQGVEARARYEARTGMPVEIALPSDDAEARAALLSLGRRGGYITSVDRERVLHARIPGVSL